MADPTNSEIAAALDELGDLYELDGAVIHRIVAYRNAAKAIREAPVSVLGLARQGRARELPGVGAIIQEKVLSLADDGVIPAAVKLRAKFPPGLIEITRLPGLGPKRARRLYEELGIDSLEALRAAAEEQKIRGLKGFGPRAEETILAAAKATGAGGPRARVVLDRALFVGEQLMARLRAHPASEQVEIAGSARRMTDSVKDLDVIATATDALALSNAAAGLDLIESAGTPTEAGVRMRTHTGLQVDLKIVAPDQFGNLLQHFTGSKQHNMALRDAAVRKGLHVSEYGVLDDATGETHRCATEAEVYALLGLEYIEPELRENRGELEAAATGTLPELIEVPRPPRRPALPYDRLGRHRLDRGDGDRRARRRLRVPRDHGPLAPASGSGMKGEIRTRSWASTSSGSAPRKSTGSSCCAAARSTSSPTARSTTPTTSSPISTGSSQASTRRFG